MKQTKLNILMIMVILGIGVLSYVSYQTGYKVSNNNMDALLMTMTIDSNLVTTGLYEELPNKVRKTMHFYIEDTPTLVNDVKIYAQVKYATIGKEVVNIDDGKLWKIIKQERVFQRKFDKDKKENSKAVPNSSFALLNK